MSYDGCNISYIRISRYILCIWKCDMLYHIWYNMSHFQMHKMYRLIRIYDILQPSYDIHKYYSHIQAYICTCRTHKYVNILKFSSIYVFATHEYYLCIHIYMKMCWNYQDTIIQCIFIMDTSSVHTLSCSNTWVAHAGEFLILFSI